MVYTSNHLPFRILCDITFHYNETKLYFIFQVIRALSDYPIESMDIAIVTNVSDQEKLDHIKSLCSPLLDYNPARPTGVKTLVIESFPNLANPWHLPWSHKELITNKFLSPGSTYTHYIHLEDDILLSFDNFCYFAHYRELLRGHRLIPSFQRVEYNTTDNRLYLLDQISIIDFALRKKIDMDGMAFVNPDYPHNATFILDKELALEYVNSKSFDRERSSEVKPQWGLCERASMGLCFENPPEGFFYRYVIPVNTETHKTPCWSWVYHIANVYTQNPRSPYAKVQPDQLFRADVNAVYWTPPTKWENLVWRLKRLPKRLWQGPPRSTGNDLITSNICPKCELPKPESGYCSRTGCPGKP